MGTFHFARGVLVIAVGLGIAQSDSSASLLCDVRRHSHGDCQRQHGEDRVDESACVRLDVRAELCGENGFDLYAFENGSPNVLARIAAGRRRLRARRRADDRVLAPDRRPNGRSFRAGDACRRHRASRRRRAAGSRWLVAADAADYGGHAVRVPRRGRRRGGHARDRCRCGSANESTSAQYASLASCRTGVVCGAMACRCRTSCGVIRPPSNQSLPPRSGRGSARLVPTPIPIHCAIAGRCIHGARAAGFTEAVEFLFTPGRVTITNEMGLIRRIYTDGRALPADPDFTNTGFSVGRWEGPALVVETVGINPEARYPATGPGAPAIGADARITERIFLKDPGTLQFDIVTEAPDVLTQPDRRTRLYTRVPKTAPTRSHSARTTTARSIPLPASNGST